MAPRGRPEQVQVHDFLDKDFGKAIPYGVYDLSRNEGWVSVGIDHDTARIGAQAIHHWWKKMGSKRYRNAQELLITADKGSSNGSHPRLWKVALQDLAVRLGYAIFRREPASGTKSSIACSSTSPRTGGGRLLVSDEVII